LNHRRSSAKTKSVPTKRAVDGGDSAAFSSIFLASGFFCSQAFSQPAPPPLTPAVIQRITTDILYSYTVINSKAEPVIQVETGRGRLNLWASELGAMAVKAYTHVHNWGVGG